MHGCPVGISLESAGIVMALLMGFVVFIFTLGHLCSSVHARVATIHMAALHQDRRSGRPVSMASDDDVDDGVHAQPEPVGARTGSSRARTDIVAVGAQAVPAPVLIGVLLGKLGTCNIRARTGSSCSSSCTDGTPLCTHT